VKLRPGYFVNEKRVGIYNRWLATLGGGEKTSLAIAEYLSRYYPVEVISHRPIAREFAGERLNVDLSRVQFTTIPDRSVLELSPITRDYDLFINASHLDYFPSYAPLSALLVFFPAKLSLPIGIRRWLKSTIRNWLDVPLMLAGVQAYTRDKNHFQWYTGDQLKMRLVPSQRGYRLSFSFTLLDPRVNSMRLFFDHVRLAEITLSQKDMQTRIETFIPPSNRYSVLSYQLDNTEVDDENAKPKAVISDLDLDTPGYRLYQNVFGKRLKGLAYRLNYYSPAYSILGDIDTYRVIWTTSAFAQKWITKYWHRGSEVLYPPLDSEQFRVGEKTPTILSVGRFFAGHHNKKHLEMIWVFQELVDHGLEGWEFHLAGNMAKGEEHERYFQAVCQAAEGYPIYIHKEISYHELIDLYAKSAIYWHAGGYGENERREPEKFEHYGITTVEAMASGCVPVVIGKGGQPEIVQHNVDGFLWNRVSELKAYTLRLVHDEALRAKLSKAAVISCRKFSRQNFENKIDQFKQHLAD
jgi:glycosyltransferase involved in cell wall biosynthesis